LLVAPGTAGLRLLRQPQGLDEHSGALSELLDSLPGSRDRGVEILYRHDRVFVNAHRRAWRTASRTVVRARRDGIDRYVVRFRGDEGCDIDTVRVRARANCRPGQVLRHRDPPALVAELLFGQSLQAGETWVFEDDLIDATGPVCVEFGHGFPEPQQQYLLEVRFDPRVLPIDCHAFARPGFDDEPRRTTDLTLNNHHTVHLLASGIVGIAWDWP
jgi:hypothetical protein